MMYRVARYDRETGEYLGVCCDSRKRPFDYPSLEAVLAAVRRFESIPFAFTTYKPEVVKLH
jgi:hypothetical protein